jgi:RNA polymerase sigma factor (TIGR02999 family)
VPRLVAGDITELLLAWRSGDRRALDRLTPLVYDELRRIARSQLRREKSRHTLQTTGLVHEAYLRLVNHDRISWRDRLHFFGAAAGVMRRVLVDQARERLASKRGGGGVPLSLDAAPAIPDRQVDLLAIHECLDQLSLLDERQARIVELRFFGGLSIEETAELMGTSPMTVKREWAVARAWLFRQMSDSRTRASAEA